MPIEISKNGTVSVNSLNEGFTALQLERENEDINASAETFIENEYMHAANGAKFLKIFSHDIRNERVLFPDKSVSTILQNCSIDDSANIFSRLEDIPQFISTDGKYEFLLRYPDLSKTEYNQWRQIANPLTTVANNSQTAATMGYEAVHIDWSANWNYGMGLSSAYESYLDCQAGAANWYGAIGQSALWENGFPAPDGSSQKFVELWIRIDNTPFAIQGLPEGYTRLDYIESSGTQYINTYFFPRSNTKFEIDFMYLGTSYDGWTALYGERGLFHTSDFALFINTSTPSADEPYISPNYGTFDPGTGSGTRIKKNVKYNFKTDAGFLYINGELAPGCSTSTGGPGIDSNHFYLFAFGKTTGNENRNINARIYGCKFWAGSELKKDMIPCRNPNGAYGFYDVVNGEFFGNSGSGEFIPGPESPIIGVQIKRNTQLPSAYTQVEYLESTGTQYINTDYKHNTTITEFKFDASITSFPNAYHTFFGSRTTHNGSDAYYLGVHSDGHTYACIGENKKDPLGATLSLNTRYNIYANPALGIFINGELYPLKYSYVGGLYKDFIFAGNFSETINGTPDNTLNPSEPICARIYDFEIIEQNSFIKTFKRKFIPCIRNSDNAAGFFDIITNTFYGNSGTGTFLTGAPYHTSIVFTNGFSEE